MIERFRDRIPAGAAEKFHLQDQFSVSVLTSVPLARK